MDEAESVDDKVENEFEGAEGGDEIGVEDAEGADGIVVDDAEGVEDAGELDGVESVVELDLESEADSDGVGGELWVIAGR